MDKSKDLQSNVKELARYLEIDTKQAYKLVRQSRNNKFEFSKMYPGKIDLVAMIFRNKIQAAINEYDYNIKCSFKVNIEDRLYHYKQLKADTKTMQKFYQRLNIVIDEENKYTFHQKYRNYRELIDENKININTHNIIRFHDCLVSEHRNVHFSEKTKRQFQKFTENKNKTAKKEINRLAKIKEKQQKIKERTMPNLESLIEILSRQEISSSTVKKFFFPQASAEELNLKVVSTNVAKVTLSTIYPKYQRHKDILDISALANLFRKTRIVKTELVDISDYLGNVAYYHKLIAPSGGGSCHALDAGYSKTPETLLESGFLALIHHFENGSNARTYLYPGEKGFIFSDTYIFSKYSRNILSKSELFLDLLTGLQGIDIDYNPNFKIQVNGNIYVNNDWKLVGKLPEECFVVVGNDEDCRCCESCGDAHNIDDMIWANDYWYCESCYDESFIYCYNCEEPINIESDRYYEVKDRQYCSDCCTEH